MSRHALLRPGALWWPTLLVAGLACMTTFLAHGGLQLETMATTEIVLTLVAGVAIAAAVMLTPAARSLVGGPRHGLWPLGLLVAFTVFSGLSVVWSVQPDASWQDAGRLLAYTAVFAAAIALVRLAPERWSAILGGLTLSAVVVCAYALATKVFPGALAPNVTYARLEEPYGYWNAIGLTAAMGAICCMWLGARRAGHALLSALAYPAMGILLVTLMLAYSRGAVAALAIGLVLWFAVVPLRLRGAALLIVGGLGAAVVVGWDFAQHSLTTENIPLAQRSSAGHELGALLVAMIVVLTLAGVAIGFFGARRSLSRETRTRVGAVLLSLIVLALIVFAGALAHSRRGFTGTISHDVSSLTNPNAKPPPNTPGRLTAVASVRARYWKEALEVFDANPVAGAGADGFETASLRYRTALLEVKHAHGFAVQTLADLGAIGLAIALALLLTWLAAAGRATHPFNRRWTPWRAWLEPRGEGVGPGWRAIDARTDPELVRYTPERIAMLSMLCVVVVFGVHSFVDWTWYVPGDAFVALLCAGWLAGRGSLESWRARAGAGVRAGAGAGMSMSASVPRSTDDLGTMRADRADRADRGDRADRSDRADRRLRDPRSVGVAVAVVIAALLAAWSQWQPQRSVNASQEALALASTDPRAALAKAQTGVARDPLSVQALFTLATIQQVAGEPTLARATLQRAVRLQPSNPQTWLELARHDLSTDPAAALKELQASIYLNPVVISQEAIAPPYPNAESVEIYDDYIRALQATGSTGNAVSTGSAETGADTLGSGAATTAGAPASPSAGTTSSSASVTGAYAPSKRASTPASASAQPAPAALAAHRAALRARVRRLLETRAPRAGG